VGSTLYLSLYYL